jgi:predicted glycoside hydrolase/deacetylase ChbG (UPF0249 family)
MAPYQKATIQQRIRSLRHLLGRGADAGGGQAMKLIIRADDVGYTDVYNIGAFETIDRGVVTSADVMLDTPGTVDALVRLKSLPWISVGWHEHFWGAPVLDPSQVPSMVIEEDGRIRFRKDLRTSDDVVLDEALAECRAQIDLCVSTLGRAPDTHCTGMDRETPLSCAIRQVCDEYGIARDFARRERIVNGAPVYSQVQEKWARRNIYILDFMRAYQDLHTDSLTEIEKYDPARYYIEDRGRMASFGEDDILEQAWHPGYMDYYAYRMGDYSPFARNFALARVVDVEALCSERLKNWIRENRVELVNFRDALYGTREYQNHLRAIGSDLCVI